MVVGGGGWVLGFLILKSEVWARNTDFRAISINFEDEFPCRETWKIEPFCRKGPNGASQTIHGFLLLKKFLTVCWFGFFFFLLCWVFTVACGGFSGCGAQSLKQAGSVVASSTWALFHGMQDLSSPTKDQTPITCIRRWILNHWTTREVP